MLGCRSSSRVSLTAAVGALIGLMVSLGCNDTAVIRSRGDLGLQPGDVISFGVVTVGMARTRTVVLSNVSDTGELTITSIRLLPIQGEETALQIINDPSDLEELELGSGDTKDVILEFAPTVPGPLLARLSVVYYDGQASREKLVAITGSGADAVVYVDPPVVDFGRVQQGVMVADVATIRNVGLGDVRITSITIVETNPGPVARFSYDLPVGTSLPRLLVAGSDLSIDVAFLGDDLVAREAVVDVELEAIGQLDPMLMIVNDCLRSADPSFDADGDGFFGDPCSADCDDLNNQTHPGAGELVDGEDNDCDGIIDEGTTAYDDDGDCQCEVGPCVGSSEPTCVTLADGDCNDGRTDVYFGNTEILDNGIDDNCNGLVDEDPSLVDADGDGFAPAGGDCDDAAPSNFPGNTERVDGVDNDCDGIVDEGTIVYDDDGDCLCELGPCIGSVNATCITVGGGDCHDGDSSVYPGASEEPCGMGDGVDTDCDGVVDCGALDADADGVTVWAGDCDDADGSRFPLNPEIADGIDNDCDGVVDEGTAARDDDLDGYCEGVDIDGDGQLDCSDGALPGDCWDQDGTVHPGGDEGVASGNGIDDNCNGLTDEGTLDWDGDGDGFTPNGGDCDDVDPSVNPAVWDVPGDGVDANCDGTD